MSSILRVDSIQTAAGGSATASGLGIDIGSTGKIGQVVQTVSTSKIASTSTSFTDVLTVSITPTATSSKILINFVGSFGSGQNNTDNFYQILRGTTVLQVPQSIRINDIASNRSYTSQILDSPSTTSEVTYKMQFKCEANEVFLNRGNSNNQKGFTTFTLMEVLA